MLKNIKTKYLSIMKMDVFLSIIEMFENIVFLYTFVKSICYNLEMGLL
jgi:hypothetical protein